MTARKCAGCGGPISSRAQLCKLCRRRAIATGVRQVLVPAPADPRTPGQNLAFHGKCSTLAELELHPASRVAINQRAAEHKRDALAWASRQFGRSIDSSKELTSDEMSDVLGWLDEQQLAVAEAARSMISEA
jgi:hypothetical protein